MMSKLKNKQTNIATLSSSSSSTITTLPNSIQKISTTPSSSPAPLTVKDKRRLQQRRNSSSPITRIHYETNLSFNKTHQFNTPITTTTTITTIPFDLNNTSINNIKSTNSTTSLNSDIQTNSPGPYRRSRIPVIINSPSRQQHNSRQRSLSARLRTNSNSNSTTTLPSTTTTALNTIHNKNSDLLFTSPPTFRKRISSSLSRDSSPGGAGGIGYRNYSGGNYYQNNNYNSSSSYCYNQQLKLQQQQQQQLQLQKQQLQLNEQKLLHQYQLKKQQQLYNEKRKLFKDTIAVHQHQQKQQLQQHQDDFKGHNKNYNNKGKQQGNIQAQNIDKVVNTLKIGEIEMMEERGRNQNIQINVVNENCNFDLQFSDPKDIKEMSTTNTEEQQNNIKLKENNVNSDIKPTTTTTAAPIAVSETETTIKNATITENTIDDNNMASKMDDLMKVKSSSSDDENLLNQQNINENTDVDTVDNCDENNLTLTNDNINEIINDIIETKLIPNGNCIVENQQIKCPNGCSPKPSSCSPISPIAEEEESGNNVILNGGSDGGGGGGGSGGSSGGGVDNSGNISKNVKVIGLKQNGNVVCGTTTTNLSSGVKMKRDTAGMTLNLNGPSTSNTNSNSVGNNSMKARTPITPKTPNTPKTPSKSNCQSLINHHSKITPKTPPVTPDSYNTYIDDDLDSVYSYSSGRSTMSCDHPYVARNGTTFSGRKMKYVVHCSAYAGQVGDDYLTPTQRAQRQLRRLKELLTQARTDLEQKDSELLRLTREVVELRLFKASLSSPEDPSNSSDAVTVREAPTDLKTSQDVSPIVDTMMLDEGIKSSPKHVLFHNSNIGGHHHHHSPHHSSSHLSGYVGGAGCSSSSSSSHQTSTNYLDKMSNSEMQSSFADSGHFEDMTTSHSTQDQACGSDTNLIDTYEEQRAELIRLYEKKIEELIKNQDEATGDLKQSQNDRIEALLQKLAEINTRYADIVPDYENAKERIRELEKQLEDLQQKLLEHEETQKKMYLHMYQKGQEAERIARAEQIMEIAHRQPNRVSIPELLQQLQSTQDELENIRVYNSRERGDCALLTAKEAISLWVLGARKTIYRRLIEAQQSKQRVDPEITLQFLKSAIYYFLTDKENSQGHLNAIESILQFTDSEKEKINKARSNK